MQATSATHDPATSVQAAERHEASGRAATHRAIALAAVRDNPSCTSAELAQLTGMDRVEMARRLPDLRNLGLVEQGPARTCSVKGGRAVTWCIVPVQRSLF